MVSTFGEKKAALERLGWHVSLANEYRGEPGKGRQKYDMDLFSYVQLPLTGQEWARLCIEYESDGSYCLRSGEKDENGEELYYAPIYIQEGAKAVLRTWFFEGGGVSVSDLVKFGELMEKYAIENEEDEDDRVFAPRTPEQIAEYVEYGIKGELNPLGKIAVCYHLTKDHYTPDVPEAQHERQDELEGAFHLVHKMAYVFGMGDFFTNRTWETKTTDEANQTMRLRRFVPAFKTVYDRVKELAPDPIEGWALVDLEKGEGEVAENGLGYCVYATKAEAERLLEQWRESQNQHEDECCTPRKLREPIDTRIKIRAVRVSLDNGIEFLDEGAEPKPRVQWQRKPHWFKEETEDLRMLFEQYCHTRVFLSPNRREDEIDERTHRIAHDEAFYAWEEAAKFFGKLEGH